MFVLLFSICTIFALLKIVARMIHTDCKSKTCLVGKTALVTGGNSGIGYHITLALLQRGCKVIIADKVQDKDLFPNIFKETGSKNVIFKYVDLSSFNSVRKLAKDLSENEEKLDILINNAGIGFNSAPTEDGLNMVMQINYFSAFLLTHLLVDLLKKAKGRIIFTSSGLAYLHKWNAEKINLRQDGGFTYPSSKLCAIMASDVFAEKLEKYEITSNTYHPGLVSTTIFKTSFQNNIGLFIWPLMLLQVLAWFIGKIPEEGAQTAIHLACSNEVKGITGKYFFETKPTFKPKIAHKKEIRDAVWKGTEEIVNLKTTERL